MLWRSESERARLSIFGLDGVDVLTPPSLAASDPRCHTLAPKSLAGLLQAVVAQTQGKVAGWGALSFGEMGGGGEVARAFRRSVLYSKAVSVPSDVSVLLRGASLTERQSDLQNGAGRYGKP